MDAHCAALTDTCHKLASLHGFLAAPRPEPSNRLSSIFQDLRFLHVNGILLVGSQSLCPRAKGKYFRMPNSQSYASVNLSCARRAWPSLCGLAVCMGASPR